MFQSQGFRPSPEDLCINADDLLSIVSWILIKSQLANVISEAAFIDDFISKQMKLHMPGYFLATLQAATPGVAFNLVTTAIDETVRSYESSMTMLYEGALLALLVVWLFLRDWRATWLSAIALPLSIIPTFAVMHLFGFSLNLITLLALSDGVLGPHLQWSMFGLPSLLSGWSHEPLLVNAYSFDLFMRERVERLTACLAR